MEKVNINVCIRPYYHDVVDKIVRKPKFNKTSEQHYVTYKKNNHILERNGNSFVIWVEEE